MTTSEQSDWLELGTQQTFDLSPVRKGDALVGNVHHTTAALTQRWTQCHALQLSRFTPPSACILFKQLPGVCDRIQLKATTTDGVHNGP
jgi:hypothetical protein